MKSVWFLAIAAMTVSHALVVDAQDRSESTTFNVSAVVSNRRCGISVSDNVDFGPIIALQQAGVSEARANFSVQVTCPASLTVRVTVERDGRMVNSTGQYYLAYRVLKSSGNIWPSDSANPQTPTQTGTAMTFDGSIGLTPRVHRSDNNQIATGFAFGLYRETVTAAVFF